MSAVVPQADDLRQFAVRLAGIAELLEQRSEHAVQRVDRSAAQLEQAAQSLGVNGALLAREVVGSMGDQAASTLHAALGDALGRYREAMQDAAAAATQAAQDWELRRRELHREQRRLRWTGWVALLVGSVLAAGGSGMLVRHHLRQLEQARFGEDVLAATRSAAITRCGERLCARVGTDPRRFGAHREYAVIDP